MVKHLVSSTIGRARSLLLTLALLGLSIAAPVWRARAEIIEALGGVCLVVFFAGLGHRAGWAAAGVVLVAKATDLDRRGRR